MSICVLLVMISYIFNLISVPGQQRVQISKGPDGKLQVKGLMPGIIYDKLKKPVK